MTDKVLTDNEVIAGRAALDALIEPLIASSPWMERSAIKAKLDDALRNSLVTAIVAAVDNVRDANP
jgi:hypothetical protein